MDYNSQGTIGILGLGKDSFVILPPQRRTLLFSVGLENPAPGAAGIDMSNWHEYPVRLVDGCKLNHKFPGWTIRFNDVLDADVLHDCTYRAVGDGRLA